MATLTRITPSGTTYDTAHNCYNAIAAEAVKAHDDAGGIPLPLVGTWGPSDNGSSTRGLSLEYQLDCVDAGYPVMPHIYAYKESGQFSRLASCGIPFSFHATTDLYSSAQYESSNPDLNFLRKAEYVALPDATTHVVVNSTPISVSAATQANPVAITTSANHGLTAGTHRAWFAGMTGGFSALNGNWYDVTVTGLTTFTIAVNGSGYAAYAGGGTMTRRRAYVSPFSSSTAEWYDTGAAIADATMVATFAAAGISPPLAMFVFNNEVARLGWQVASTALNATQGDIRCTATTIGDGGKDTYTALLQKWGAFASGIDSVWSSSPWGSNYRLVGYNSFPSQRFKTAWGAMGYGPAPYEGQLTGISAAMQFFSGASPEVYFNHWQYNSWTAQPTTYPRNSKAPWLTWSMQNEAMCMVAFAAIAYQISPYYWFEISTWDSYADSDSGIIADFGQFNITRSASYFKGWAQYCMWVCRPRLVREFRPGSMDIRGTTYTAATWQMHMDMVGAVHQDETLQRFWRTGTLVENTALLDDNDSHPFGYPLSVNGWDGQSATGFDGSAWEGLIKNYHLPTNLDTIERQSGTIYDPLAQATNVLYPIYVLAYVIGAEPTREWLIYAHSTGVYDAVITSSAITPGAGDTPLTNVIVTIPNYGDVTLPEVPVEGAFYLLSESGNQIARPDSDITTAGWIAVPAGSYYATLDEATADDADYCYTTTTGNTFEIGLSNFTSTVSPSANHIISYRGYGRYLAQLVQGSTVIATWTENDADYVTHTRNLSAEQIALITDYDDLRLRFVSGS